MLNLKPGVKVGGLRPEMTLAALIVYSVFDSFGLAAWVTSALDGKHKKGSLHSKGLALDFRTKHIPREHLHPLVTSIKEALGPEFDVILESEGKTNEHVHIEHDPKA